MEREEDCRLCQELERGFLEVDGKNLGNRVISDEENFVVIPALGPLREGHIMIVSKEHYLNMGQLPQSYMLELKNIKERAEKAVTEKYQKPFFFEHGPTKRAKAGSCIDHMHLVAVPLNEQESRKIVAYITERFPRRWISVFHDVERESKEGIPYILIEEVVGEKKYKTGYVFEIPKDMPSQYMRQVIATKIGHPERWDWRTNFGLEETLRTYETLKEWYKT